MRALIGRILWRFLDAARPPAPAQVMRERRGPGAVTVIADGDGVRVLGAAQMNEVQDEMLRRVRAGRA